MHTKIIDTFGPILDFLLEENLTILRLQDRATSGTIITLNHQSTHPPPTLPAGRMGLNGVPDDLGR